MDPAMVSNYIGLSAVLLLIGIAGVILRRNPLIMLMGVELMLNAANLALLAFAKSFGDPTGHVFAFLVITVAAAEAAVGLGVIVVIFRRRDLVDVDDVAALKG